MSRIRCSIRNLIEPWTEACAGGGNENIRQEQNRAGGRTSESECCGYFVNPIKTGVSSLLTIRGAEYHAARNVIATIA